MVKKFPNKKKLISVEVDKGMSHGQKIPFPGESDQAPGIEPGDIVVVLVQKKHDIFQRAGHDLQMEKTITLSEALCGVTFHVQHLDARILVVKTEPGEVIKPGEIRAITEEGMPKQKDPFSKGSLYIKFNVTFPESGFFDKNTIQQLEKLLPPKNPVPTLPSSAEKEEVVLGKSLANGDSKGHTGENNDEDFDGEERPQQGGVQCTQS